MKDYKAVHKIYPDYFTVKKMVESSRARAVKTEREKCKSRSSMAKIYPWWCGIRKVEDLLALKMKKAKLKKSLKYGPKYQEQFGN